MFKIVRLKRNYPRTEFLHFYTQTTWSFGTSFGEELTARSKKLGEVVGWARW